MIDSLWEWTIISLFAFAVGYYAYHKRLSDLYNWWKASKSEEKNSEEADEDAFDDPLPEDRIFKNTVPLEKQGFKVTPNHPHRHH